jgi:uncharacterized protein YegJ (DUF2314 family)
MPLRCIALLLLALAAAPIAAESVVDRAEKDELYLPPADDPDMDAAFARARQTLDGFLAAWRDPAPGMSGFAVKVGIDEGENTEYFWIALTSEDAAGFTGQVNNEPRMVTSVAFGQKIVFARERIVDWVYQRDDRMLGNYTACAMLEREPEHERRAFEQRFGLRCES